MRPRVFPVVISAACVVLSGAPAWADDGDLADDPEAEPRAAAKPPVREVVVPIDLALWHRFSVNRIYGREGHHNYLSLSLASGVAYRLTGLQLSAGVAGVEREGVGIQLGGLVAGAGRGFRGAQIGGLVAGSGDEAAGLQLGGVVAGSGGDFSGIQLGGLVAGSGDELTGIQIGGLVAGTGDEFSGIQLGGLLAGAGDDVTGIQIGGLAAGSGDTLQGIQVAGVVAGAGELEGVQVAAGVAGAGRLSGLQVAGLVSGTGGGSGVQVAGVVNYAEDELSGVQLSLVNIGGDIEGLQVGLVNIADRVNGAQVGLVNVASHVDGAPLGLVSYVEDGPKDAELWTSTVTPIAVGARLGSHRVYSMGVVGLRPAPDDDDVLTLGLGLGYHADVASDLGVEVDVLAHYVTFGYDIADRDAWWGQTRLKAVYAATDFVHLLAGLSLNVAVSSDDPEGLLTKGPDAMLTAGDRELRLWPGAFAGVRL